MNGNPGVITVLQAALPMEAFLNLQYRHDWREIKAMGIGKLSGQIRYFGSDAHRWMKHITDRILFFGADVEYEIPAIKQSPSVTAMFESELALEMTIITPYEENIQVCMKALDDTTRNLFEHLLKWHQTGKKKQVGHVLWLEQQLRLIKSFGESEYLAEKM